MIGTMFDAHITFDRPDLEYAPLSDYPCGVDDCESCEGISGCYKCPHDCHEVEQTVNAKTVEEAA